VGVGVGVGVGAGMGVGAGVGHIDVSKAIVTNTGYQIQGSKKDMFVVMTRLLGGCFLIEPLPFDYYSTRKESVNGRSSNDGRTSCRAFKSVRLALHGKSSDRSSYDRGRSRNNKLCFLARAPYVYSTS